MTTDILPARYVGNEAMSHTDTTDKVVFGFWLYIMSDCLLFAALFATYAVLGHNTAGGPGAKELFDLHYTLDETMLLLFSSISYGMAMLAMQIGRAHV